MDIVTISLLMRAFYSPHVHRGDSDGREAIQRDHEDSEPRYLDWIGMLFGPGLHAKANGFPLAASVDAEDSTTLGLADIETFLAVLLTNPLDAFAIASTLKISGWSVGYQNLVKLFVFSCLSPWCPVVLFLIFLGHR